MIHEHGWKTLQDRRKDIRLTMLYKIINDTANIPHKEILLPADTKTRSRDGYNFCIMTKNANHMAVELSAIIFSGQ